ncbi:hypothetical protein [Ulvibacter litoralis]|uniref:Uncharacterized protein n=1 Tax=Ulvibacter litoralis TaxID=227084 RepID=A0A1G7I0D3_9FLAO|nr:hypothetical protein [Ulvibacter litoralis]GHC62870.1 hypothetical protein GCM10008083_30140 [Ulvibacter litoralis]SDF06257.1 hypothetical protein SAMN05421855_10536 [Ulvibacter litoralis]
MRAPLLLLLFTLLLSSCNSVKRNQKFLAKGNYDQSISLAVKKLQKDKASEKNDAHIALLEEAFKKAVEADTRKIAFLKKEDNPATIRERYYLYNDLNNRQELIRPLLPLYSQSLNRNASFKLVDYNNAIVTAKKDFLAYLYEEASAYMNRQTIDDYRTAYNIYCEIDELQSNYRDVPTLKEDAHFYGTDFVFVTLNNRSGQLIPFRLERELLDFNTYGLDDFWTQYHSERQQDVPYNLGIALNFRNIAIAPERVATRDFTRTQEIKTGSKYKRNRAGEIINDEDGNPIKIDTYETATAVVTITEQTKSVLVSGDVSYRDLESRRDLNSYPLSSEFIFENDYASYRGDKRALTDNDLLLLNNRYVPFPSNEQMVFDAGEDIKIRLKDILKQHTIR